MQIQIQEDKILNTALEHGLSTEEFEKIISILGRIPNLVEIGIFSVMWSEHCSYKSTRKHIKKLPITGKCVICGPGENAGVIDIEDGDAAVFKMESHNHPSYIEPFHGSATGVGGILRDVFTMGARPVAVLNSLRFGDITLKKTKYLLRGVVRGVGSYGNSVGIPNVGGECEFDESYNYNNLVNAMAVGIAKKDKIFYSAAYTVGDAIIYAGAKTGRDGIHGATMASAEFDEDSSEKRPTVQVGDPFAEKRVMEACLELMATGAISAIQDMGAAGLTCSSLEMADKGGTGVELHLEKVPTRETGMTPYEIMLSESQERMLFCLNPAKKQEAEAIFQKWEVDFAEVGKITNTGKLVVKMDGEIYAEMPVKPLSDEAPIYDRPYKPTILKPFKGIFEEKNFNTTPSDLFAKLEIMLSHPNISSKKWLWQQYDYRVMNDTLQIPGGDAGVVRVHGTKKALAISSDCTPRYCLKNPIEGGKQAVAESYRNISAVGAKPLAITNCLNFANPENPEIMGQIVGCLKGMGEACEILEYPVVSGNASLYNETSIKPHNHDGKNRKKKADNIVSAIKPTPTIGGVGLLKDYSKMLTIAFKAEEETIIRIGETKGHLGCSVFEAIFAKELEGKLYDKNVPPIDLYKEKTNASFIHLATEQNWLTACHDISDGGILVAIAEMAIAGGIGAEIDIAVNYARGFGEDQARYIITAKPTEAERILLKAPEYGIEAVAIGKTCGKDLKLSGAAISLASLKEKYEETLEKEIAN